MEKRVQKGKIIIFKTAKGPDLEVHLEKETVWLTQNQIAVLFGTQRPAITKHLNNIFKSKELDKDSVSSILELTASDGKRYKTQFYNLDAIISIGYRVNSKRATQFRVWATRILNQYLVKGYAINNTRLIEAENRFQELQATIDFLKVKMSHKSLSGQEKGIFNLLADYSKTLTLLEKYDTEEIIISKKGKGKFVLEYSTAVKIIKEIKVVLMERKEASDIFGVDVQNGLRAILGNILQTFDKKELYPSIEEKASHLLYFIIKDHPFIDGNKRIASFLFIYFLDKNNYLFRENGEKKINDNALTALALLIAVSDPKEKDKLIKIITQLLVK